MNVNVSAIDVKDIVEVYENTHSIDNIDDESDLPSVIKPFVHLFNAIRAAQQQNDREQARICYLRETSECNKAYCQSMYDELTAVDMVKVNMQLHMGAGEQSIPYSPDTPMHLIHQPQKSVCHLRQTVSARCAREQ